MSARSKLSTLRLQRDHWEQMYDHVARGAPLEACGLVAGKEGKSVKVFEMENELKSPVRYRVPAKAQLEAFQEMEAAGWELLAIYHSHPAGPATPSATDLAEATYPETAQLIWSPGEDDWRCRAFRIHNGCSHSLSLEIQE